MSIKNNQTSYMPQQASHNSMPGWVQLKSSKSIRVQYLLFRKPASDLCEIHRCQQINEGNDLRP